MRNACVCSGEILTVDYDDQGIFGAVSTLLTNEDRQKSFRTEVSGYELPIRGLSVENEESERKLLETFDWKFNPQIDRLQIEELRALGRLGYSDWSDPVCEQLTTYR